MTAEALQQQYDQVGHGDSFGPVLDFAKRRASNELGLSPGAEAVVDKALELVAAYLKRWSDSKPPRTWFGVARQFIIALL